MKTQITKLFKGILNSPQMFTYLTKDGKAHFQFSYHLVNGKYYEIDIHHQPRYGLRNSGAVTTHRLRSSRKASRKICITSGKEPRTLDVAQKFSTQWAELTWEYIKTGVTIDQQFARMYN